MDSEVINGRKIQSVERLWDAILRSKKRASTVLLFHRVMLPVEMNSPVAKEHMGLGTSPFDFTQTAPFVDADSQIELERPFLGEVIWSLYFCHRAIIGRTVVKTMEGISTGTFRGWDLLIGSGQPDTFLLGIVEAVLGAQFTGQVRDLKVGSIHAILEAIEADILREVTALLYGTHLEAMAIEKARQIIDASTPEASVGNDPIGFK